MFIDVFSLGRWRFPNFLESDLVCAFLVVIPEGVRLYGVADVWNTGGMVLGGGVTLPRLPHMDWPENEAGSPQ